MGSFLQWHNTRHTVRRVTWVCGREQVLVDQVFDSIRHALAPAETDYVSLVAGEAKDRDIWAAANQYPLDPTSPRLVVVRSAERVSHWDPLLDWIDNARLLPRNHLLFISGDPDLPRKAGSGLVPPASWLRDWSAGALVQCGRLPSEAAVQWLRSFCPVTDDVGLYLLERVSGKLHLARDAARKAAVLDGQLTRAGVDFLVAEHPTDQFAMQLVKLNKPLALSAVPLVPEGDCKKIIGQLDHYLTVLGWIHKASRTHGSLAEVRAAVAPPGSGVSGYLVDQLYSVAEHYPPEKCSDCFRLLAFVDEAVRAGVDVKDGPLEALCALWLHHLPPGPPFDKEDMSLPVA